MLSFLQLYVSSVTAMLYALYREYSSLLLQGYKVQFLGICILCFIATLLSDTHGVRCYTELYIAVYFESYDLTVIRSGILPVFYYYVSVMVKNKPFRHDLISIYKTLNDSNFIRWAISLIPIKYIHTSVV